MVWHITKETCFCSIGVLQYVVSFQEIDSLNQGKTENKKCHDNHPVELAKQVQVWLAILYKTPVCIEH